MLCSCFQANQQIADDNEHCPLQPTCLIDNPLVYLRQGVENKASAASRSKAIAVNDYPMIDLRPWLDPTANENDRNQVVEAVLRAATTTGGFYITGHGINPLTLQHLQETAESFFTSPRRFKTQYAGMHQKSGYCGRRRGDFSGKETPEDPLREIYSTVFPSTGMIATALNKPAPADYQAAMDACIAELATINQALHCILARALAKAKQMEVADNHFCGQAKKKCGGCFRTYYFDEQERGKGTPSVRCDPCSLTVSYAVNREELRDRQWIKVPPSNANVLHVGLGHLMHIWSNGLFQPSIYRFSHERSEKLAWAYYAVTCGDVPAVALAPVCAKGEEPYFHEVAGRRYVMRGIQ